MILSKTIIVGVSSHIKYYESLGYLIPKYWDAKHYRWSVKNGTTIEINIKHLKPNSNQKIQFQCDLCGCIKWTKYQDINKLSPKTYCKNCITKTIGVRTNMKKNHANFSGKNHPRFNSNLSNLDRQINKRKDYTYNTWRKKVLKKDNYMCRKCNSTNLLRVHHILDFNHFKELRLDVDNGVTLCFNCHEAANGKSIHNIYGKFPTKENFDEFMKPQF